MWTAILNFTVLRKTLNSYEVAPDGFRISVSKYPKNCNKMLYIKKKQGSALSSLDQSATASKWRHIYCNASGCRELTVTEVEVEVEVEVDFICKRPLLEDMAKYKFRT